MSNKKKNILIISLIVISILLILLLLIVLSKNGDITNDELLIDNNSGEKKDNYIKGDNANTNIDSGKEDVVSYFEGVEEEINNDTWDSIKEKAKDYFITIVDFIFYDKEINGYSFKDLSSIAKIKVISIALKIDNKIENNIPKYKETISGTSEKIYTDIKEKLVIAYFDVSSSICKNNSEECGKTKEVFSDIKSTCKISWEFIKTLFSQGTSKLGDWYEIYSGK